MAQAERVLQVVAVALATRLDTVSAQLTRLIEVGQGLRSERGGRFDQTLRRVAAGLVWLPLGVQAAALPREERVAWRLLLPLHRRRLVLTRLSDHFGQKRLLAGVVLLAALRLRVLIDVSGRFWERLLDLLHARLVMHAVQ